MYVWTVGALGKTRCPFISLQETTPDEDLGGLAEGFHSLTFSPNLHDFIESFPCPACFAFESK